MRLLNVVFHPMPFMQPTPSCLAAVAVCVDSTEIICTVTACLGGGNGFMLQLMFVFIVSNKINSFLWIYIYLHKYIYILKYIYMSVTTTEAVVLVCCTYICVCVHMYLLHMLRIHIKPGVQHQSSSASFYPTFWGRVSLWTQNTLFNKTDWQMSLKDPPVAVPIRTMITDQYPTPTFGWVLRTQT